MVTNRYREGRGWRRRNLSLSVVPSPPTHTPSLSSPRLLLFSSFFSSILATNLSARVAPPYLGEKSKKNNKKQQQQQQPKFTTTTNNLCPLFHFKGTNHLHPPPLHCPPLPHPSSDLPCLPFPSPLPSLPPFPSGCADSTVTSLVPPPPTSFHPPLPPSPLYHPLLQPSL